MKLWHENTLQITGSLWGESTEICGGFASKGDSNADYSFFPVSLNKLMIIQGQYIFDEIFVVSLNELLNIQLSCLEFEMPCSCDITVMHAGDIMDDQKIFRRLAKSWLISLRFTL